MDENVLKYSFRVKFGPPEFKSEFRLKIAIGFETLIELQLYRISSLNQSIESRRIHTIRESAWLSEFSMVLTRYSS